MPQIISLGEALIDLFAGSDVRIEALHPLQPAPGGAPANVAVALARLGAQVGFIGKVGADDYGRFLVQLLAAEGVDVSHFVVDAGGPTMLALVAAPSPTEQHFVLYHGADMLLCPAELDATYVQAAKYLAFGSVTLTGPSGLAALQAARWARAADRQVIFDVNLRPTLWAGLNEARRAIIEAVDLATVVKLNEVELAFLTGSQDMAGGARVLVERGVQLACVSIGAQGSYFDNGVEKGHVPAFCVETVDTTGCGDAFVAGLAYALSQEERPLCALSYRTLYQVLRFANACGALAATRLGAMSALPQLADVRRLLETENDPAGSQEGPVYEPA